MATDPTLAGLRLEQYRLLAIHPPFLEALLPQLRTPDLLAAHVAQARGRRRPSAAPRATGDKIAIFEVSGALSKRGSSLSEAPSVVELRRAVREAAADPQVAALFMVWDSPGGSVDGIHDLALDLRAAAEKKPVFAYAEDLLASAAYVVASQATKLFAGESALVGSLGVFTTVSDFSEADAAKGIKVHLVRSGRFKGLGAPGTEITGEDLAELQRVVDDTAALFNETVAAGRGLALGKVEEVATGQAWLAAEALELGLVDAVATLDEALSELVGELRPPAGAPPAPKAEEPKEKLAAGDLLERLKALQAVLPEASDDLLVALAERQVRTAADLEAHKDKTPTAPSSRPGVEPVGTRKGATMATQYEDPITEWNDKLEALVVKHRGNRQKAVMELNRKEPELRLAMVEAWNEKHRPSGRRAI
jgi:signal peptide peptidase SppA